MFEIEKFALFVYEQCGKTPIFSYSVIIQKIIDKNPEVAYLSNIIRAINKLKKSEPSIVGTFSSLRNSNYSEVFVHFQKSLNCSNNFIYFFCHSKEYSDEFIVLIPYKMYEELKNSLIKFNNLKSFT